MICFAANKKSDKYKMGKVRILNLFALYEPKSPSLQSLLNRVKQHSKQYNEYYEENKNSISTVISDSTYIILAWVNVPESMKVSLHNTEVSFVYDCLKLHEKLDSVFILK